MRRSNFNARYAQFRSEIRKKRIEAKLTQKTLAARLERPQSFVAKYEGGERRLDLPEFIDVADAIGFDPAEFIRALRAAGDDGARNELNQTRSS